MHGATLQLFSVNRQPKALGNLQLARVSEEVPLTTQEPFDHEYDNNSVLSLRILNLIMKFIPLQWPEYLDV